MQTSEEKVKEIMAKLRKAQEVGSYEFISEEQTKKRLRWYEENKDKIRLEGSDVKKAYTLLITEYLCLNPKEAPIVYEDAKKIVWISYNFCPALEACKRLRMDTREVCKKAYEEPVQALISKVNPDLKFSRNYKKIRSYEDYCEEIIELSVRML